MIGNQVKEASAQYQISCHSRESGNPVEGVVRPPGYKHTEVGVIPMEWNVIKIGRICDISVGKDVDPNYSSESDSKYCYPVFSNTVDVPGIYGYYDYPEYSGEVVTVVGRGVGLGTAICRSGGFGAIGRLIVLFPKKGVSNKYLANYINHKIDVFSESSGVPQLTGIAFANYNVAYPSSEEQTAIANALSDVDALITALEKLIAKKHAIKTAAMQQLLTGKKRLPPFDKTHAGYQQTELGKIPEDWEVKSLGAVATFVGSGKTNTKGAGEFPLYGSTGQIGTCKEPEYEGESILVARVGANAGRLNFVTGDYGVSDNTIIVKLGGSSDIGFYKCQLIKMNLNTLVFGSGQPLLTGSQLKAVLLPVPKSDEQAVIAGVLSDMDSEIDRLEQRLFKTQQLKQGMMQELLTGRTRLV